ncbi:hypothetical protein L1987_19963 [Smallanthus sonchifolius]|uniref:Uncharacterized protein n=1 Tax=Smallanthus sonchifolius TaxID=185202 RepID=A0ACB9IRA5_9ASTR|nr:hypothetical protein L1987_19963 [Smallanthus sonchifolius]
MVNNSGTDCGWRASLPRTLLILPMKACSGCGLIVVSCICRVCCCLYCCCKDWQKRHVVYRGILYILLTKGKTIV